MTMAYLLLPEMSENLITKKSNECLSPTQAIVSCLLSEAREVIIHLLFHSHSECNTCFNLFSLGRTLFIKAALNVNQHWHECHSMCHHICAGSESARVTLTKIGWTKYWKHLLYLKCFQTVFFSFATERASRELISPTLIKNREIDAPLSLTCHRSKSTGVSNKI